MIKVDNYYRYEAAKVPKDMLTFEEVQQLESGALTTRGIKASIAERCGVKVSDNYYFYPGHKGGKLVAYKYRNKHKKEFGWIGDTKDMDWFGENLCSSKGELIIIAEGQDDWLATLQMLKTAANWKNPQVVSPPNGGNVGDVKRKIEWLEGFKQVIIVPDQDEQGRKFTQGICELLTPGKVKVSSFSEKDPNAMLQEGKSLEFVTSVYSAKTYAPAGIVSSANTLDLALDNSEQESVPLPWDSVNKLTYGIRLGELDTWTSGTSSGKSQIFKEVQYHLLKTTPYNIGIISLEETLGFTVKSLLSLELNKRIHLPDVHTTPEEIKSSWESIYADNRVHFASFDDSFGDLSNTSLLSRLRYMVKGLDCKFIFIDHLTIAITEMTGAKDDERRNIDVFLTQLRKLVKELNIWIGLIVHLRKTYGGAESFEEGAMPTLDDLRGSGGIKQISNSVYATARNQQAETELERNTSYLNVLKCRFTGQTGAAGCLYFNPVTGRMTESVPVNYETQEDF